MRRLLPVALTTLALALSGCTASTDGGLKAEESPSAAPSQDAAGGAAGIQESGGPQPTDVTSSPGTIRFTNATEAVERLLQARIEDDRPGALLAAGPRTVEKLWALPAPSTPRIDACQSGAEAGSSHAYDCYQRYEGGASHFSVDAHPAAGWLVVDFEQNAD
ncbi:hypothetical protein [Actinocorallia sp. A-T 12471]|uniref:hypothetical protein n=1 Tax=Actinocorallia sp. A-T 12471 TaxID=3089813 RepID=UPI0029D13A41|nr:hypothetical protein [Actinocorallia sp. A-T 12471]MDX6739680.1 hypothetical protein [Actinocorallia sp. A-T 12471]